MGDSRIRHEIQAQIAMVLALAYMSLIWWLSSQARPPMMPVLPFPHADKLIHLVEYGILSMLLCHALGTGARGAGRVRAVFFAVLLAAHYGVIDELHQSYVPNRWCSAGDMVADTAGAILAALVWWRWRRERASPPPEEQT